MNIVIGGAQSELEAFGSDVITKIESFGDNLEDFVELGIKLLKDEVVDEVGEFLLEGASAAEDFLTTLYDSIGGTISCWK